MTGLLIALLVSACAVEQPVAVAAAPPVPQSAPIQQQCREFDTPVTIGGQQQQAHGTACLQPDGSWKVEQSVAEEAPQTYVVPPQVYAPYYPPDYLADPWYYGPPLFVGGLFVGGGWGFYHGHDGWHGAWHDGWHGGWNDGWHSGWHGGFHGGHR